MRSKQTSLRGVSPRSSLEDDPRRHVTFDEEKRSSYVGPQCQSDFRSTGSPRLSSSAAPSTASSTLAITLLDARHLHPSSEETTYPEGGLRANLVVFGSFCAMLAGFGLLNSIGTFQAYLSTHQLSAYSESTVGWLSSIYVFLSFFCGVLIGPIFDAKGPRYLVATGSVCLIAGMMGMASSTKYWHFLLSFSILSGIGTSLLFTPAISSIGHFFNTSRARATGLAATGGSMGGIIFPLALPRLFALVGFPWATRIMAFTQLLLVVLANFLIRSRLPPKANSSVWPDFRIFRDKVFTLTTAGVFFIEWGLFVPLAFIPSYALKYNTSPTLSYQLLAILNVGSCFGRWLPGYVADRWGRFNTMILTSALSVVIIFGLWLPAKSSVTLLVTFALLFGFSSGSGISLTPVCVGQCCETEQYGRYYATCYTPVSFGCLTGIPIAGQIVAASGGEYWGLVVFTGVCYACGLICFAAARGLKAGLGLRVRY